MSRWKLALVAAALGVTATMVAAPADAPKKDAAKPAAKKIDPKTIDGGEPKWLKPETPKQRMARLGTTEDPGIDPDLTRVWKRFGKEFTISKYERRFAAYDQEFGWLRPVGFVFAKMELYQQNEKWVWVWEPVIKPEAPQPAAEAPKPVSRWNDNTLRFFSRIRSEFTPLDPPDASRTVRFELASEGLPRTGSWRNSLTAADMNEDGNVDIIAPPARGAVDGDARIWLGDGKGKWTFWAATQWPHDLQYGSVAAADFNKDGHMDLAFGVHLNGVFIFAGDGKGKFTEMPGGTLREYPTRRVRIADVNADSWPDVVAITEGPNPNGGTPYGPLLAMINKAGKTFEMTEIAQRGTQTGGDWLTVGNFNDDSIPDFFLGSIYFNAWDVLYTSNGPMKWTSFRERNDGSMLPSISYFFGSAAGKFSAAKRDDAVVSYIRVWPTDLDPKLVAPPQNGQITAVDHLLFGDDGKVKRTSLMRWSGGDPVMGLASGDLDGDGKLDVIFTRRSPREAVILLGDGKGGFTRAAVEGLPLATETNYDLALADVNGDGRPDVIVNYEAGESRNAMVGKTGSIQVFLNRGSSPAASPAQASSE